MQSELDQRTLDLVDALHRPGAALLYALLAHGDATERELVERTGATQPTANRRLAKLECLGLIERRNPGRQQTPNRRWSVRHQAEAQTLLMAAVDLSSQTARREELERARARLALREAVGRVNRAGA